MELSKYKTPEEMEADYQLGLQLQKVGYIRKNWYCPPENLYGARLMKEIEIHRRRKILNNDNKSI